MVAVDTALAAADHVECQGVAAAVQVQAECPVVAALAFVL
jgi:hypothetical protein